MKVNKLAITGTIPGRCALSIEFDADHHTSRTNSGSHGEHSIYGTLDEAMAALVQIRNDAAAAMQTVIELKQRESEEIIDGNGDGRKVGPLDLVPEED